MIISNTINRDGGIPKMLNLLKRRGYDLEFRREATCIYCIELKEWIVPENFSVDEYYYFRDDVYPDADRMLYAISIPRGRKGLLIDACNVYQDNISVEMMRRLNIFLTTTLIM